MYTTIPHLQSKIRTALQHGQLCRIYAESLTACWPRLSGDLLMEKITQFAAQNHWQVTFRNLGNLGLVAEFEKLTSVAGMSPSHAPNA
jgi:hypothetical protein